MAAGPIRHKVKNTSEDKFDQQVIVHQLYNTPPKQLIQPEERPKVSDAYRWIMENTERTERIVADILTCVDQSKQPIVLTERREHAEIINSILLEKGIDSVVLKGAMRASERKDIEERLPTAQVVVATGKYVGEGFDLPRLDTLFLAMPIIGSVCRPYPSRIRWQRARHHSRLCRLLAPYAAAHVSQARKKL